MLKKIKLLIGAFTTLCFCLTYAANGQSVDDIRCLKFSSPAQYEEFVETGSLATLSSIPGFSDYVSLASTQIGQVPPSDLDEEQADDDYDVKDDVSTPDWNNFSAHEFLSQILNSDKVVIIGNWIIKVDLENERALVLNTQFAEQYTDLLDDNLENSHILTFSLDDDGVEILKQLDEEVSYDQLRLWCSDRNAKGNESKSFFYRGNRHRLDAKVVYQRSFIIFSLIGKAKTQKRVLRIWWDQGSGTAVMANIELSYEVRCKDRGFQYSGDPCQFGCISGYTSGSTCHYRPYWGTRALKNYTYKIDFKSTHGEGHVEIEDY